MPENITPTAGTPIIINAVPAAPAVAAVPASGEPLQLKAGRVAKFDEARAKGANEVLKGLGIKKSERARLIEEIKAGRYKLAEAKQEVVAARGEADAVRAEADALKPYKDQVEQLTGALKQYADQEFQALPEPFQKAIVEMKLDDPKARLDMINVFKRTGVITAAPKVDAAAPKAEPKAEAAKPDKSTTLAAPPADAKPPAGATLNYYEHWRQLVDGGQHVLAAQFLAANKRKIIEQRPATR